MSVGGGMLLAVGIHRLDGPVATGRACQVFFDESSASLGGARAAGPDAVAALAALTLAVDALADAADPTTTGERLDGSPAADVVRDALRAAGRLSAIAARLMPVIEADGWWALDGARSITTWVAAQGRVPHAQAGQLVRLGRAFRDDLRATAADAVTGRVPIESAHAMAA